MIAQAQAQARHNPNLHDVWVFVNTCRNLLSVRGKLASEHIGGGLTFHDGGLEVREKGDSSLTVTYHYGDARGKPTVSNPVIMIDEAGKMFRCHDEWRVGIDRLTEYLVSNYAKRDGGLIPCPHHYGSK